MKFLRTKVFVIIGVMMVSLLILSACGQNNYIVEEFQDSDFVERGGEVGEEEVIRLVSSFLVEIDFHKDNIRYDYIISHENFYFNTLFLQTRWNALVNEINWSFGWGMEAYEYIRDNYDELWEMLIEQLRSEVAVTFLAYQLGFEADAEELRIVLENMESILAEVREDGVDVDTIFFETFGTTQENWEIHVARQLASIAMIDSLWEEHSVSDAMIQRLKEDIAFEELPRQAAIYHILVDSEYEARLIYEKMQEGIHPRDLHDEFSQDPGGPFYTFPRGVMVHPFEEWAFQAEAGDVGIVPTQFGYHVSLSYGKELYTEELEHLARLHHLDLHILDLIRDLDIHWGSQPEISWVPQH